jgi:hypothetical protein
MLAYSALPWHVCQRWYTIVCQCTNLHQIVTIGWRCAPCQVRDASPQTISPLSRQDFSTLRAPDS